MEKELVHDELSHNGVVRTTKTCVACREVKPVEEFNKYKSGYDGYSRRCSECYANGIHPSPDAKDKVCAKCQKTRLMGEFNKNVTQADGHNSICRACQSKKGYSYRNKIKTEDPRQLRVKRMNDAISKANYRASQMGAEGELDKFILADKMMYFGGKCVYCGADVMDPDNLYQIEHVQALSRGGSNLPDNIAIACEDCNSSKRDKDVDVFADHIIAMFYQLRNKRGLWACPEYIDVWEERFGDADGDNDDME